MSIAVIKTPNVDLNGLPSKWQAVHEPINYTLERQDQQVQTKYKPNLGTARVQLIGSLPLEIAVGQRFLWVSGSLSEVFTIIQIQGNILITDSQTPGTVLGGHVVFLDGYNNYFVETQVLYVDTNGYNLIGTFKNKTNLQGQVDLNVSSVLKTVCEYDNKFDYTTLNKAIKGEGGKYNLKFREIYNGIEQPLSNPFGAVQYFSNSSKQILEQYGSNMAEYVPTLDATRVNKAKFLTVFDKPTAFKNMPFSMSFIYSENLLNEEIEMIQNGYNINDIEFWNGEEVLDYFQRAQVNRLMLIDALTDDVKTLEIWLQTTGNTITTPPLYGGNTFEAGFAEPYEPVDPTPPNPTS